MCRSSDKVAHFPVMQAFVVLGLLVSGESYQLLDIFSYGIFTVKLPNPGLFSSALNHDSVLHVLLRYTTDVLNHKMGWERRG